MTTERPLSLAEKVELLQNLLVHRATGGALDEEEYQALRKELLRSSVADQLPRWLRTCRDTFQFWGFIKSQFARYQERREFLWDGFRPALEFLEEREVAPSDARVGESLETFDPEHVHDIWTRALERRGRDPEGAITLARNLLETVCKYILDDLGENYPEAAKLPQLYGQTAKALNLAPSQHSEKVFKQILGGCHSVVEGLGSLRNQLSDSHGQGRRRVRPRERHAELAVNLAGTMATFLVETWRDRSGLGSGKKP